MHLIPGTHHTFFNDLRGREHAGACAGRSSRATKTAARACFIGDVSRLQKIIKPLKNIIWRNRAEGPSQQQQWSCGGLQPAGNKPAAKRAYQGCRRCLPQPPASCGRSQEPAPSVAVEPPLTSCAALNQAQSQCNRSRPAYGRITPPLNVSEAAGLLGRLC